ncbi:MAG: DUF4258 domain-containing protein [bacterium]|nr:DUF4258 domain-containing protein [bacterium]
MMKLLFPRHFQHRMMERGIDIDHIKRAIKNPDFTKTTFEGRILVRKEVDSKRIIEAIYYVQGFKDSKEIIIITAYYVPNKS